MQIEQLNIEFGDEILTLTNQRVLYWKMQQTLILSDIHIGKAAHFRKHGIAVPNNVMLKNLDRLEKLITHFNPNTIIIVGDLFHTTTNTNTDAFKIWLRNFTTIHWVLVKGNHDIYNENFYQQFGIKSLNKLNVNKLTFIHQQPEKNGANYYISGHTHPGVQLSLPGKQFVKLPCFYQTKKQLILPAFSLFTGLNTKNLCSQMACYPFTESNIWEL